MALEISKLEMATEEEQIAHALKLSLKEFKPTLQDFVWLCDEKVSETASDKTDNATTSDSWPTVTEGARSADNDITGVESSSLSNVPSMLHVSRPTNKTELKSFLAHLGRVA